MTKLQNTAERPPEAADEMRLPDAGTNQAEWLPSIDELFADPKVRRRVGDTIANAVLRRPSSKP